jgi:hypothetical protein
VVAREDAEIGALLTLQPPTRDMVAEAAAAGFYTSPWGHHPRIQILTIEQLLQGARIDYPAASTSNVTLRRAPVVTPKGETLPLPFGPSPAPAAADRPGLATTRGERPRGLAKAEPRGGRRGGHKRRRGGA